MEKHYEIKGPIEILGPETKTDDDGNEIQLPRRVQTRWVKRIYDGDTLESESKPHRPGPVGDDDLDREYPVAPDGTKRTAREIWEAAEKVSGSTLL